MDHFREMDTEVKSRMGYAVGMGEMMIQMNPTQMGPLRYQTLFERHVAGSEGNTLIQMQKLGVSTRYISRVDDGEMGSTILHTLLAEGIDISAITMDTEHNSAVYFVQRGFPVPSKTMVVYYRKDSAASQMKPDDINDSVLEDASLFLVSGITPALSENCKASAIKVAQMAKDKRIPVVFDTNIRVKLLPDRDRASHCLVDLIRLSDILITGTGDLSLLFDGSVEQQIHQIQQLAPSAHTLIVKRGGAGARVIHEGKEYQQAAFPVHVVDELGAGDSFNGAFLAAWLMGKPIQKCLESACAAGAITVGLKGDIEPLPSWKDIQLFLEMHQSSEERLLR